MKIISSYWFAYFHLQILRPWVWPSVWMFERWGNGMIVIALTCALWLKIVKNIIT